MATFSERVQEAVVAIAVGEGASREADLLTRQISELVKKNTSPFIVEPLEARRTALHDKARQMRIRLGEIEREHAGTAEIRVISWNKRGAQIIIHHTLDNGKKASFTRHVHRDGKAYVGLSTLTNQKISYRLPGEALEEAA